MATQARPVSQEQNRFLRPLIPVVVLVILGVVFLFVGGLITQAQGNDASKVMNLSWWPYVLVGGLLVYGVAVTAAQGQLWKVGTREVVYMAIGAALYAVLSWAFNLLPIPSVSSVALRPAIVIPIFFGMTFGPAVGFFTGFVGNVLGDVLTGWGVSPTWDIGNGLVGLVAGLMLAFRSRGQNLNLLTALVVVASLVFAALLLAFPDTDNQLLGGTVGGYWWGLLLIAALAVGARLLLRGREEVAAAEMWGALAIIAGIGFAAIADIWWNGYSFVTALLGEFVPAAGPDLLNALILLPILLAAWGAAQARSGR